MAAGVAGAGWLTLTDKVCGLQDVLGTNTGTIALVATTIVVAANRVGTFRNAPAIVGVFATILDFLVRHSSVFTAIQRIRVRSNVSVDRHRPKLPRPSPESAPVIAAAVSGNAAVIADAPIGRVANILSLDAGVWG